MTDLKSAMRALENAEIELSQHSLKRVLKPIENQPLTDDQFAHASAISENLRLAIDAMQTEPLCLPQAVALWQLLLEKQISCRLTFGFLPRSAREDPAQEIPRELASMAESLASRDAHVWVDVQRTDGRWQTLLGGETAQKYHVIGHHPKQAI